MKVAKFRVARPTENLNALRAFYIDALGLVDGGSFENHNGYDGFLVSTDDAAYEIEFTQHPNVACPAPTGDNVLVFYFESESEIVPVAHRLAGHGIAPITPLNPYWIGKGLTYTDPDGYCVVLFDLEALARSRAQSGTTSP